MTTIVSTLTVEPFRKLTSKAVVLPRDDIDTDQIIPARFLTTTERSGLGVHLFADWRFDNTGLRRPDFPLNSEGATGSRILVAGRNFGCGSSREHAPWALLDFGFRAVVAPSFADIFRENALKNGLLPVALAKADQEMIVLALAGDPELMLDIDLGAQTITISTERTFVFPIEAFAKRCLSLGVDQLGYLLDAAGEIDAYERLSFRAERGIAIVPKEGVEQAR
jgi:3-isopropylmalate/(R)-2-methylmalate dehydratase small subunit